MNKGTERQQRVCFEAKKLTVEELAASGDEYYVIPPFQRPYRWSNGQVERLVQDLLDFLRFNGAVIPTVPANTPSAPSYAIERTRVSPFWTGSSD